MRRTWWLAAVLGLAGCGALDVPGAPPAGDLLGAPTTLNVAGRLITAQALPQLQGRDLRVQLLLKTARPPLPPVQVTGVFVVTAAGVWKGTMPARPGAACPEASRTCLRATASAGAAGLQPGEQVQVVARLRAAGGQILWLRDADVRVRAAPAGAGGS